jgi:hypothetical protein
MIYLGKRIQVPIPERGEDCKPTGRMVFIVGKCQLEPQPNEWLDIQLQTAIDRMPVSLKSLADIKVIE